jgi:lysophospholipase L1-like esterase
MKQILCFGDSNTYGLIPGGTGRYPWEVRWTGRLQEQLTEYGVRVVEEGLCGRTTVFADLFRQGRKGSDLLPTLLETHSPLAAVVLMLGTNDCKQVYGASAAVIAKGMEQLVLQVRSFDPQIPILVMSPIHLGEDVWKTEYDPEFSPQSVEVSRQLRAEYEKIAERHDCYFLAASDVAEPSAADREHLDEKGHKALSYAVFREVKKMLPLDVRMQSLQKEGFRIVAS